MELDDLNKNFVHRKSRPEFREKRTGASVAKFSGASTCTLVFKVIFVSFKRKTRKHICGLLFQKSYPQVHFVYHVLTPIVRTVSA
ncbi:hypothetical protein M758_UG197800 [Ceratodon purpureus]|nr:hypothetical protein M758_UG197800 [Ceratodon purpureus]